MLAELEAQRQRGLAQFHRRQSRDRLAYSLLAWHEHTTAILKRQRGLRKVVRRMQRRELSAAFGGWLGRARESRKLAATAARVVGKLQNIACASGFER